MWLNLGKHAQAEYEAAQKERDDAFIANGRALPTVPLIWTWWPDKWRLKRDSGIWLPDAIVPERPQYLTSADVDKVIEEQKKFMRPKEWYGSIKIPQVLPAWADAEKRAPLDAMWEKNHEEGMAAAREYHEEFADTKWKGLFGDTQLDALLPLQKEKNKRLAYSWAQGYTGTKVFPGALTALEQITKYHWQPKEKDMAPRDPMTEKQDAAADGLLEQMKRTADARDLGATEKEKDAWEGVQDAADSKPGNSLREIMTLHDGRIDDLTIGMDKCQQDVDKHLERLDVHKTRLDQQSKHVGSNYDRLDSHNDRLVRHGHRLETTEDNCIALGKRIEELKERVHLIEAGPVSKDKVESLEKRIWRIERSPCRTDAREDLARRIDELEQYKAITTARVRADALIEYDIPPDVRKEIEYLEPRILCTAAIAVAAGVVGILNLIF